MDAQETPPSGSGSKAMKTPGGRYHWGRLFVRWAPGFAGLLVVSSVLGAVASLVLVRRELSGTAHEPDLHLVDEMAEVSASCQRTADLLTAHFGPDVLPDAEPLAFPARIDSEGDARDAVLALESHSDYVRQLKHGMTGRFAAASDWLVDSMGRKAERVRQRIESEHGPETAELQSRVTQLRDQLRSDSEIGLYTPLDHVDYSDRMGTLDDALDFLTYLDSLTDSATVQPHIDAAAASLKRMRELLPQPTPESSRLKIVAQIAHLRQRIAEVLQQETKLRSEELGERLTNLAQAVTDAVHSSWRIDADLASLRQALMRESTAFTEVRGRRRGILLSGVLQAVVVLVVGIVLSVVLVIAADVVDAILAVATAVVAGHTATPPVYGVVETDTRDPCPHPGS